MESPFQGKYRTGVMSDSSKEPARGGGVQAPLRFVAKSDDGSITMSATYVRGPIPRTGVEKPHCHQLGEAV